MTDLNTPEHWREIHENWRELDTASVRAAEMADAWRILGDVIPLEGVFLEVACSSGGLLRALADRPGASMALFGCDLSPIAIELAVATVPEGYFKSFDAKDGLPYADDTFDVSFCGHLVEHLQDPVPVLREMARVTKDSSHSAGTTSTRGRRRRQSGLVIVEFPYEDPPYPEHVHQMLTYDEVGLWVEAAGLTVIELLPVLKMNPTNDGVVIARKDPSHV